MGPGSTVFMLLFSMFILTFLSGFWPGIIKDPKTVNLVGVLGGGFLMGSAIVIVLPEAIHSLVSSSRSQ